MTDLEIAKSIKLEPIDKIAEKAGIDPDVLEHYGKYKAKLPLSLIDMDKVKKSKLILVTAINPTPAGEGKTTVSIGLNEAMNKIGKKSMVVLREPSLGPVFGIKGGATGGGYSQVVPMEDINLHFTGDFNAIEKAHNLLAAVIDNNLQNRQVSIGIDSRTVKWRRVMDVNDRALRRIVIGLGGTTSGFPRETGFDITAASEVMAALCLSNDLKHLKEKLGNIFVGYTFDKTPVFARDLKANGAMAALMKDAIKPNLVQTLEHNPAIIHGGPFANIAQGTNTVIATRMGLSLADYVITEAGFAYELGAEKFFDIKCAYSGLRPQAVVIVATIRALKYHGGKPLKELYKPDLVTLEKGFENLEKHLENQAYFKVTPIVAINRFATDTEEEINLVKIKCKELGVACSDADVWGKGGDGTTELAELVVKTVAESKDEFTPLYSFDESVESKIKLIATNIYGAKYVDYTGDAKKDLKSIYSLGFDKLPVCIAKTQNSLSDNPKLLGRPRDFLVTVREIQIASGAGFLIPITGEIMRMPGLPAHPAAERIDVDEFGEVTGLF